jgi:class 3 adenylate cyclase
MVTEYLHSPYILQHAEEIATMAIDLLSSIKQLKIPHKKEEHIHIRVGIHTGKCL